MFSDVHYTGKIFSANRLFGARQKVFLFHYKTSSVVLRFGRYGLEVGLRRADLNRVRRGNDNPGSR